MLITITYLGVAMNRKEWREFCKIDRSKAYYWYNKVTKKRTSKEFECDPRTDKDAKVIHHLRDTEEQRKYNDEHYELFGFEIDENGNEHFEYGKYVVFWTKEHHREYHSRSDETRKRISKGGKGKHHVTEETRKRLSDAMKYRVKDPEYIKKLSDAGKAAWVGNDERRYIYKEMFSGINNPNYGKKASDETKARLSESHKGQNAWNKGVKMSDEARNNMKASWTDEKRKLFSKLKSGKNNPSCNRTITDDEKERRRLSVKEAYIKISEAYKKYKDEGGKLGWQDFKKFYSSMKNDGK